jgi:hypothetical protein
MREIMKKDATTLALNIQKVEDKISQRFACKESRPKRLFLSLDVKIDSLLDN